MNGIAVIWKPAGMTSHDVVARVRRVLKIKRIGHTGTLDPMAEGVLPVCVGKATKAADIISGREKEYRAVMTLGIETDTQDAEGKIIKTSDVFVTDDEIVKAAESFKGEIMQIPPMYSAVRHNGKRLYELAREGITVERQPRRVTIYDIQVTGIDKNHATLNVVCSKGTYIRTLCADIGRLLGCGAHMSSLARTRSGNFTADDAVDLDQFEANAANYLIPIDHIFKDLPKIILSPREEARVKNGAAVGFCGRIGERVRLYSESGEFLCVSRAVCGKNGVNLKMEIGFY